MMQLLPLRLSIEQVYPVPFRAVDTATWYALQLAQPGRPLGANQMRHGTAYVIQLHGVLAQVFVLGPTDSTTLIEAHILQPVNPIEAAAWRERVGEAAADILDGLFAIINECVHKVVGLTAQSEGYAPPLRGTADEIVTLAGLYHPDWTDGEIAAHTQQHVSLQSLRNARARQYARGAPKTSNRGRKKTQV